MSDFKSGGAVDPDEMRKLAECNDMLMRGTLQKVKNDCLYVDGGREAVFIDCQDSEDVIFIARASIEMCRLL